MPELKRVFNTLSELTELMEHNSRLLKFAEAGDWDKVKTSERQRDKMIHHFYEHGKDKHSNDVISNATKELLRVTDELKHLASQARSVAKTELDNLNKGKVAINAYEKHRR